MGMEDFDFRMRHPEGDLGTAIESIWFARGTVPYASEQISPTGSTVVVLVLGDAIRYSIAEGPVVETAEGFVAGPHDRPATNEPTGETHAVGIVTTATGCARLLGRGPRPLRGRVLPLGQAWSRGERLRAEAIACADPDDVLRVLLTELTGIVPVASERAARCAGWVARLEAEPTLPIAELAQAAGLSYGHFVSEFSHHTGLTPKTLARLVRMRQVIADIDIEPTAPWIDIAHRHGWFDQAHFIRDFKRHTGVSPNTYVERQRRTFLAGQPIAGSGVGFVPDT
ncbi:MAG: AraC family transcriptional regulator [Actinomycetota bacterium]